MKILAVIPARAGSKGIPHKNYKPFDGKPLITYAIENALRSKYITAVAVTTDDPVVKQIASGYQGVSVIDRPAELAGDLVTLDGVVNHALRAFETSFGAVDYCVTMQATSPLLTVDTLDSAIGNFLNDSENDSAISVVEDAHLAWSVDDHGCPRPKYVKRVNRQELPAEYREAGAFVISKASSVTPTTRWKNGKITIARMPAEEAVDIDTMQDWISAEAIMISRRTGARCPAKQIRESNWYRKIESGGVYFVAEIGVNYYDIAVQRGISPLDAAKLMIDEAAKAGVDAVKFQSYKADTIASKFAKSYWDRNMEPTASQYELFKKFDSFGRDEYKELSDYSAQVGVDFMSTAFDYESADFLDSMMDVYKISSSDLSNLPFIEYQALKQKPIFLSVGASNLEEIDAAVDTIRKVSDAPIALLHCVLEYPTPVSDVNLLKISSLRQRYANLLVGYSDHSVSTEDCVVQALSVALGARILEKHFTLDKTIKGNDHYHSMDPDDVRRIIKTIGRVKMLMGNGDLKCLDTEQLARANARRSLVLTRAVRAGEKLTRDMIAFKRPGTGISPSRLKYALGRSLRVDCAEDTILCDDMLD